MCGLCGVFLTETSWSDASVGSVETGARTRRHERLHRVALANRVLKPFGSRLSDWNGVSYVVSGPTGQTSIVPSVASVWPVVEQLRKVRLDPLDEGLIEALERD